MVDFLFILIELFSLSLMVEMLQAEICRIWHFSKMVGHFEHKFPTEGVIVRQPL